MNNPDDQYVPSVGPIPVGMYHIGEAFVHHHCGPISMRLTPVSGTDDRGRDGFLMHGDTASRDHTASDGCIIMDHDIRVTVSTGADRALRVVSNPADA